MGVMMLDFMDWCVYDKLKPKIGHKLAALTTRVQWNLDVEGIVKDNNGKPLPNIDVVLYIKRSSLGWTSKQYKTVTNESGHYQCSFKWRAGLLDSSKFTAIVKIFKNSTLLREMSVPFPQYEAPNGRINMNFIIPNPNRILGIPTVSGSQIVG
jgi:hypothetical protein